MGGRDGTSHRRLGLTSSPPVRQRTQRNHVDVGSFSGTRMHLTEGDLGCQRRSRANLSSKGYQKSVPQSCGIIVATGCNTNFPLYGTGCEGLNDKRLGYNFQLSLLLIGCSIPLEVVSGKEVKAKNNSCKEGLFCLSNRSRVLGMIRTYGGVRGASVSKVLADRLLDSPFVFVF